MYTMYSTIYIHVQYVLQYSVFEMYIHCTYTMYVCLCVCVCVLQEKILEQIHFHLTGSDDLDSCSASHCLPHQKCALSVLEMVSHYM